MKPLLVYDGECGFCRRWVVKWQDILKEKVAFASYQDVAPQFPTIPLEAFQRSIQFIDADSKRYQGAEAVFRALAKHPPKKWMLFCYQNVPGFRLSSEWFYQLVANHRGFFSKLLQMF